MQILNIYGQPYHDDDAKIIGNAEGLKTVYDAIYVALINGKADTHNDQGPLFASDGEGYDVIIEVHNDEWGIAGGEDSFWNKEESHPEYTSPLRRFI